VKEPTQDNIESFKKLLEAQPLFWHYSRKCELHEQNVNLSTAEDVLSERLVMARLALEDEIKIQIGPEKMLDSEEAKQQRLTRLHIARSLMLSVPFLWKDKPRQIALDTKLPSHKLSSNIMPFNKVWFTYEGDICKKIDGQETTLWGFLLSKDDAFLNVSMFLKEERAKIVCFAIPWNRSFSDDEEVLAILKMLAFLNTPLTHVSSRKISRPLRRRMQRNGAKEHLNDEVQFVDLRVPVFDQDTHRKPTEDGPERDFRWIVRGHYRAQWYPSEEAHQLIWIDSHIKGPDGAPLKPRAYRIVQ
jgi:hypothetical protein